MKKVLWLVAILALPSGACFAQEAKPSAPVEQAEQKEYASITNFFRVNQQICTGGQPRLEDLERRSRKYCVENNVHLLPPDRINDNNRLFAEGCRRLGYRVEQFPVNVKGCLGSTNLLSELAILDPGNELACLHRIAEIHSELDQAAPHLGCDVDPLLGSQRAHQRDVLLHVDPLRFRHLDRLAAPGAAGTCNAAIVPPQGSVQAKGQKCPQSHQGPQNDFLSHRVFSYLPSGVGSRPLDRESRAFPPAFSWPRPLRMPSKRTPPSR